MPYPRLTKCMPDETRHNPFYLLHKALRFGHCRMLTELGAQEFISDATSARLLSRLVEHLDLCQAVAEARQEALLSTLASRGLEVPSATCQDHLTHLAALSELQSLVRAVNVAAAQRRRLAGRSIYRCYALYAAADMERMDEDETMLLATLHQSADDGSLRAIEGLSFGGLTPEQLTTFAGLLLPALPTAELEGLLGILHDHMAPERFALAVEEVIRPFLGPGSFAA